jgi:hypothetical protein
VIWTSSCGILICINEILRNVLEIYLVKRRILLSGDEDTMSIKCSFAARHVLNRGLNCCYIHVRSPKYVAI